MPLTVGGGVRTLGDIRALLLAGADKVSINTAAVAAAPNSSLRPIQQKNSAASASSPPSTPKWRPAENMKSAARGGRKAASGGDPHRFAHPCAAARRICPWRKPTKRRPRRMRSRRRRVRRSPPRRASPASNRRRRRAAARCCCATPTATRRSTTSPRIRFICPTARSSKRIRDWADGWTIRACRRKSPRADAAECLRSDTARGVVPRRARHPPQPGQRRQDVRPRRHFGRTPICSARRASRSAAYHFKDYPQFLKAFLRGEIDRLVVVPHLRDQNDRSNERTRS